MRTGETETSRQILKMFFLRIFIRKVNLGFHGTPRFATKRTAKTESKDFERCSEAKRTAKTEDLRSKFTNYSLAYDENRRFLRWLVCSVQRL
jgi:hypothetical protein